MNKPKLLILGGGGFIGTNLANYFGEKNNYEVFATQNAIKFPNHRNVSFLSSDLSKKEQVKLLFDFVMPDIVIMSAAVTTGSKDVIERPFLHVTDNTIINSLVLEACHTHKVKHTIFLSCTVMYQPQDFPQRETDWSSEDELYPAYFGVGNMKVYTERLCEFYSRLGDGKYTAVRHSNVYGPYDKFDLDKCHLVPAMINKISRAVDTLEVWGDGKAQRDVLYIDDLVDFIDKCILNQETRYELFNCGQGVAYSVLEIIRTIQRALNKTDLKIEYNLNKPNIPTTVILNCQKARQDLGWFPKVPLDRGIDKTLAWYGSLPKFYNINV